MKKILIIEDEPLLLGALAKKLSGENFKVFEAQDGEAGLATALGEHPDLILLDIILPLMDGMTLLKKLREDDWGKTAGVILLTNLSDGEKIKESMERDAYDYLVKSDWKLEDIVKKVKEKLEVT